MEKKGKGLYYESTSTKLDGCPACRTKERPVGRMELVASVPLCGDCGDAWLAAVAAGAERPGALNPTARLSLYVARALGYLIRHHRRRVAGAVAAALARGAIICRHRIDAGEPCTCGTCARAAPF